MRRKTRQRDIVARSLRQGKDFLSAQQLHHQIVGQGENIGLATVYRNLQVLQEDGLIEAIRDEHGEWLYRVCHESKHHHHLVCRSCRHSEDIAGEDIENWVEAMAKSHNFVQVEHNFDVFGLCANCVQEK